MRKPRINLWRIIPVCIDGVRAGVEGVAGATSAESEGGHKITKQEAHEIAEAVGSAIARRVLQDLLKDAE